MSFISKEGSFISKIPNCHPNKKYWAKGLCVQCYRKELYKNNKNKFSSRMQKYYKKNKSKIKQKQKEYAINNKENYIKHRIKYKNNRRKIDLSFRIEDALRSRIYTSIKNQKINKSQKTKDLIGCSIKELKGYIESKFLPGMDWSNYNYRGWHLDHIKPCSKFNLTSEEEQNKCIHYTNLQPLWAKDNLSKSNIYKPTLAVITCASQKKDYPCKVTQMYDDSPQFRLLRDYTEKNYDKYVILSAHYGLLHPEDIIEPYSHTVMFSTQENRKQNARCLNTSEKKEWAQKVYDSLNWNQYSRIDFYIGRYYKEFLVSHFKGVNNVSFMTFKKGQGITINQIQNLQPKR